MSTKKGLKWKLEILWWGVTALVVGAVLYPVWTETSGYPFYAMNIVFVVAMITLTRYIFLLKHTFIAHWLLVKIALIFVSIPVVFLLVQELNYFQTYIDENGFDPFIREVVTSNQRSLARYIQSQMLFFGVGSIIAGFTFPMRMLISVWRQYNKGTV